MELFGIFSILTIFFLLISLFSLIFYFIFKSNYNKTVKKAKEKAETASKECGFGYQYTKNLYDNLKQKYPTASDSELVDYIIEDFKSCFSFDNIFVNGPKEFRESYDNTEGTGLTLLDLIEISYGNKTVPFNKLDNGKILFWVMITTGSLGLLFGLFLILSFTQSKKNLENLQTPPQRPPRPSNYIPSNQKRDAGNKRDAGRFNPVDPFVSAITTKNFPLEDII